MDKYEQTLKRVAEETERGALKWTPASPDAYGRVVLNPDHVVRASEADLATGGKTYRLLLVERKRSGYGELDESYEFLTHELLVLDAGRPVLVLYDGLVDRDDLRAFADLAFDADGAATDFFDALLHAPVPAAA